MMKEIPNHPGYYADTDGNIYTRRGGMRRLATKKARGHFTVRLSRGEKKRRPYFVHRLILETFVGPRPDGMVCRHGPGGQHDNSLKNLSWGTQKQNMADKWRDGTAQFGNNASKRVLNELQVRIIRRAYTFRGYGLGVPQKYLAELFGVRQGTISDMLRGRSWRYT